MIGPGWRSRCLRLFGTEPSEIVAVSAKTGLNVDEVLAAVVERVEPPRGDGGESAKLRMLLLTAIDQYRARFLWYRWSTVKWRSAIDSSSRDGPVLRRAGTRSHDPGALRVRELRAGHVGYVITGSRDVKSAKIGDTLHHTKDMKTDDTLEPLPGFRLAKPMVFQGLFPTSSDQFDALRAAVDRLTLNDASVTTSPETSAALGPGFRCGFLGK